MINKNNNLLNKSKAYENKNNTEHKNIFSDLDIQTLLKEIGDF